MKEEQGEKKKKEKRTIPIIIININNPTDIPTPNPIFFPWLHVDVVVWLNIIVTSVSPYFVVVLYFLHSDPFYFSPFF